MNISKYPVLASQTKLPFYLTGIGVTSPEYHIVRSGGLISSQILFTKSGKGILKIEDKELLQTGGSIFFLSSGVPHEYYPLDGDRETAWVVFRGEQLEQIMQSLSLAPWCERSDADLSDCERIFGKLLSAAGVTGGEEECSLLLYELILAARTQLVKMPSTGKKRLKKRSPSDIITPAVLLMDKQYMRDITLTELAESCSVSLQHFCRLFRQTTYMRPMEYLARRRIAAAKELLTSTSQSVNEIARLTGFESVSYFGWVFRRYENTSPSEYRKNRGY